MVFPALSLEPSQPCVFEAIGMREYIQSEKKEFGMLRCWVSLGGEAKRVVLLTLFMSPSEDRTSQTVVHYQSMFRCNPSKRLIHMAGTRGVFGGVVSMRL